MQREGYRVTAEFEAEHWWFRSRRDLFLLQVERAARELGHPGRALRLLDYGCGTGHNLAALARFGEVRGADVPSPHADEFLVPGAESRIDLSRDTSAHHGAFEIATALDVLEHVDDDVAGLAAIGRFLAPGGQVVLTVPAQRWLWGGEDVISEHRRRYTRPELARTCERAGFEIRFLAYFNLAILPAMAGVVWARRLLARRRPPRSNLGPTLPALNDWLYRLTGWEARRVGAQRWRPPTGASLVCRGVRAGLG
jgi:SAM-dependent methyltransferase